MWPFPRILMRWKEPAAFTEVHRSLQIKWRIRPYILILMMIVIAGTLIWYIQAFILKQAVWPFWALCLLWIAIIAFLYFEQFFEHRWATTVYLWSNGIGRYTGGSQWVPTFKQLKTYSIHESTEYRILELTTVKDFTMLIGMPLEADVVQLEGILSEHGLAKRAKD